MLQCASLMAFGLYSCDLQTPEEPALLALSEENVTFDVLTIEDSESGENLRTSANHLHNITFHEGNPLSGLHTQFPASHSFRVVNNPSGGTDKVGRIELRDNDRISTATTSSARSEVLFPKQNNNERWYSFSLFFPNSGYNRDSHREIITQWHQASAGSPPNAIEVINDKILLSSVDGNNNYTEYPLGNVERGKWNEYVFHYIHSTSSNGLIEIWQNGKKIHTIRGANMKRGFDLPRFKFGVYKWRWDSQKTDASVRTLFYNNIKIGNERATYSDMTSGNTNTSTASAPSQPAPSTGSTSTTSATSSGSEIPRIVDFSLIAANTNTDLGKIAQGNSIKTSTYKLNVRANMPSDFKGEVKFELSGANSRVYSDTEAPFCLFGDDGKGNYYFNTGLRTGRYTLKATPILGKATGQSTTITFNINN